MNDKLTGKQSLSIILGSIVIVICLFFGARLLYFYIQRERALDEKYKIVAIVQKSHSRDVVATPYLAELMQLSSDQPVNLYSFDPQKAARTLQSLQIFKKVKIQALQPGIVCIDYTLRSPVAMIADFENRAIDGSGKYLFPMEPFFTPKNIPEIYLGSFEQKRIDFAFEVMKFVKKSFDQEKGSSSFFLKRIDVSPAFAKSANREIILFVQEGSDKECYVRLNSTTYQDDFSRFFQLLPTLKQVNQEADLYIVDLRIDRLALVKGV